LLAFILSFSPLFSLSHLILFVSTFPLSTSVLPVLNWAVRHVFPSIKQKA
jgi:archaellum component FlaG (FlaF/FlaG flagellin family)